MFDNKMIKIFFEGAGGNVCLLLFQKMFMISMSDVHIIFNMVCHGLITFGTLALMYRQYKQKNKNS